GPHARFRGRDDGKAVRPSLLEAELDRRPGIFYGVALGQQVSRHHVPLDPIAGHAITPLASSASRLRAPGRATRSSPLRFRREEAGPGRPGRVEPRTGGPEPSGSLAGPPGGAKPLLPCPEILSDLGLGAIECALSAPADSLQRVRRALLHIG